MAFSKSVLLNLMFLVVATTPAFSAVLMPNSTTVKSFHLNDDTIDCLFYHPSDDPNFDPYEEVAKIRKHYKSEGLRSNVDSKNERREEADWGSLGDYECPEGTIRLVRFIDNGYGLETTVVDERPWMLMWP